MFNLLALVRPARTHRLAAVAFCVAGLVGCGGGGPDENVAMPTAIGVGTTSRAFSTTSADVSTKAAQKPVVIAVRVAAQSADGVGVFAALRYNGVVLAEGELTDPSFVTYYIEVPMQVDGGVVDVVVSNAGAVGSGAARTLEVDFLAVGSKVYRPTGSNVTFDQGAGEAAFDGETVSAGRSVLAQSGALRFSLLSVAASLVSAANPAAATTLVLQPPYLRLVMVDAGQAAASDTGPGTVAVPYKSIGAAMRNLRPGDDVVLAAGTYRESVMFPTLSWGSTRTRIRAAAARSVVIKGSADVSGWTAGAAGVYWTTWTGEEPQQVFRAGEPLRQIGGNVFAGYPRDPGHELQGVHSGEGGIWPGRTPGGVNELVANSFTYQPNSRRLYVKLATPMAMSENLEVSQHRHVLRAEDASGLTVEGLDFAHSNTSVVSRWGAIKVSGQNNLLNDLVVKDMDAVCVQLSGTDSALTNSTLDRCGQTGVSGSGRRLTFSGNQITHANTRGFNKWWEAGGMKLIGGIGLHDAVIKDNVVAFNAGDGIWVDWKNSGNLIEGNTAAYNAGFGIQYEASQTGTLRGNHAYGNDLRGIYLLESANCLVEGNSAFGNTMEGIGVVDGTRSAADASLKPTNNRVLHNTIAWNDFNRNWVQLVLPGLQFGTVSDTNTFKAEGLLPRISIGFASDTNYAFVRLQTWRAATGADVASTEQLVAMPAGLKAALASRRLLSASEIATYLGTPANY